MPNEEFFVLMGRAHADGTVHALESTLVNESPEPPGTEVEGPFRLSFVAAEGAVLAGVVFDVRFTSTDVPRESVMTLFSVVAPFPPSTARVEVSREGRLLASIKRPSSGPKIDLLAITWPEPGTGVLTWTMTNAEGTTDSLTAAVLLTIDGETWRPLQTGITEPYFAFTVSEFAGSEAAQMKVVVSDGFNPVEAVSAPFAIPATPPVPVIILPQMGSKFRPDQAILFRGTAFDRGDGMLPDQALQWRLNTSEKTTAIGTGAEVIAKIPEGNHIVELVAVNSAGSIATAECEIRVATEPNLRHLTAYEVSAEAAVSAFSASGSVIADDTVAEFSLDGLHGTGVLQSRTWPTGVTGTVGDGLTPYLYRVALTEVMGSPAKDGITTLLLPFSEVVPVTVGSKAAAEAFILTEGAIGERIPASIELLGSKLRVLFDPPLRPGDSTVTGESSFFLLLASRLPPGDSEATLVDTRGQRHLVQVRTPSHA